MNMIMITVFVPKTYITHGYVNMLDSEGNSPRPSEFWLNRPDSWMAQDLATISISPKTWDAWNKINEQTKGKQLLKG